ncbi:SPW repeat protein [Streptomyces sp. AV19]|uniref:SPW repeat protein n=1 Tax=Streptomyces sp. AV19 TaxID=2793068 RepID=UPI0018FE4448|nr:SPW repeat protein [Streptomyces sp. AV19]MBH1936984.1 SPW repeat protein [Streptomyces sp. AV19]MDG4533038.1 SPW repeat protein [Streptomyces sp. AV19]
MTAPTSPRIEQHPDIMALRAHSEETTALPAAQAVEALALLCGVYLAASPWIVGFNGVSTLTANNLITGIAFALLVGGFGSAYERTHSMSWAALGVGVWTIISPWVVAGHSFGTAANVSNVIVGAVCCVTALALAGMGVNRARTRR